MYGLGFYDWIFCYENVYLPIFTRSSGRDEIGEVSLTPDQLRLKSTGKFRPKSLTMRFSVIVSIYIVFFCFQCKFKSVDCRKWYFGSFVPNLEVKIGSIRQRNTQKHLIPSIQPKLAEWITPYKQNWNHKKSNQKTRIKFQNQQHNHLHGT